MSVLSGFGSPVLNDNTFRDTARYDQLGPHAESKPATTTMTMGGTIQATAMMLGATWLVATLTWMFLPAALASTAGMIIGLILGLVICFKPNLAPALGLPYAAAQGLFVGGLSLIYAGWVSTVKDGAMGGVTAAGTSLVFQAILITFGIAAAVLIAYCFRVIRVNGFFMKAVCVAVGGWALISFASFILGFFGIPNVYSVMYSAGPLGIAFAAIPVVLATLVLLTDFKMIEDGVQYGAPKYMNWFAGYAVLVSLVWLYVSLLRLLALLAMRRD